MKYLKVMLSCLREDKQASAFVGLPFVAALVCASTGQWLAACAFLVALLTGLAKSLDHPDVQVARLIHKLTADFEAVKVERNDSAFPDRLIFSVAKPKVRKPRG